MPEVCCAHQPAGPAPLRPETGKPTRSVDRFTVLHHARPDLVGRVRDPAYGFCDLPACDVVYVGAAGQLLPKPELRARVGLTEPHRYSSGIPRTSGYRTHRASPATSLPVRLSRRLLIR